MSDLTGTRWARKKDGVVIEVDADASASGGQSNRSLLLRNTSTGRTFWGTPEGLRRKYTSITD